MDASEEPWIVSIDNNPPRIILTCKKAKERDTVVSWLKKTIIFRHIHAGEQPDQAYIIYKDEKKRDKGLAIMLTTMHMMRIKMK